MGDIYAGRYGIMNIINEFFCKKRTS